MRRRRRSAGDAAGSMASRILLLLMTAVLLLLLHRASGQGSQNWFESPPEGYHVRRLRFEGNFTDEYFTCSNNASVVHATVQSADHDSGDAYTYTELHLTSSEAAPEYGSCVYNQPLAIVKNSPKYPKLKYITSFRSVIQFYAFDQTGTGKGLGEGMTFMIVPGAEGQPNSTGGYLGLLNGAPRAPTQASSFAAEIDTRQQEEFSDPPYHHVGVDITSLQSIAYKSLSHEDDDANAAATFPMIEPGTLYSAWMSWDSSAGLAEINLEEAAKNGASPEFDSNSEQALLKHSISILDSVNFYYNGPDMYVGFSSATGEGASNSFRITFWMFEYLEEDASAAEPHRRTKAWLVVAVIVCATGVALFLLCVCIGLWRRRYLHEGRRAASMAGSKDTGSSGRLSLKELEGLDYGPRRFQYKELSAATKGFSAKEVLGKGGFGCVYRGVLRGKGLQQVAVKRISETSKQGAREFVAEVKIIGRLRHKNLVQLLGWCFERQELLLVYEYMPHGSLDQALFSCEGAEEARGEAPALAWAQRVKILAGVATALQYLHEDWEQRVVHRDVKSSNVMLDAGLNARLGDFGLARLYAHSQAPQSTATAGTLGYLAPELLHSSKATDKSDVFSFGVVALETACGRRPLTLSAEAGAQAEIVVLVDWVWNLFRVDRLLDAADPRLAGRFNDTHMSLVLQLGLLCCHPDPTARPSMRQVLQILAFEAPLPPIPRSKPVPTFRRHDDRPLVDEPQG
ncbi:protein MpRLK-Pelle_L-LEC29 [Marchantia polymorpha subsp. ruderalis]|nr:hypothetical protein MARPO_0144s0017 [Marchantia polymorpha]BBN15094.1 hypothetical protein Mp_6g16970 [Marchantia polymorpha subsp. ruderalis]|eukprot:PTQ29298.1 hypothetical protein MARPO_0144s0017 [Marchantia polymorpha]